MFVHERVDTYGRAYRKSESATVLFLARLAALSVRLKRSRSSSTSRPRPTETRPLARLTPPGGVQNSDPFGPTLPSELAGVARAAVGLGEL